MIEPTKEQRATAATFVWPNWDTYRSDSIRRWVESGINADDHTGLDLMNADGLAQLLAEREAALRWERDEALDHAERGVGVVTALRAEVEALKAKAARLDRRNQQRRRRRQKDDHVSFQSITILGNLGKDPVVSYAQSGKAVCKFSVATSEKRGGEEKTTWFDVVTFEKLAELCGEHLAKGRTALVQGRISIEDYTDKEGAKRRSWSVIAQTVQFVGGRGGERSDSGPAKSKPVDAAPAASDGFIDDDLPF